EEALADVAELTRAPQRAMLEDAFAAFEREVEPAEARVFVLELVDHAQRLRVVLEAAVGAHARVQRVLPRVAERGVAQVVRERDRFSEVFVEVEVAREVARDLRDLERVGQARAEQVAFVVYENLRLVL